MRTGDITIVFQGAVKAYTQRDTPSFADVVKRTRRALPGARVVVSTWEGAEVPKGIAVDEVLFSSDPGALAPLKLTDTKANNVNRQIASTRAGMDAVRTPYAVKLRTDCFLEHAGFIDLYESLLRRDGRSTRIVTSPFFTLDTSVFERIPFHVSDWFQFARSEVLQSYWRVPFMTAEAGAYYERYPHAEGSNVFERRFRAEYAVEQHICMHYARSLGYTVPNRLNDISTAVVESYCRFLADEIVVLDPWQSGLVFPKYRWANESVLQRINNVMHIDWLALSGQAALEDGEPSELANDIARRHRRKAMARWLFAASAPLHHVLFEQSGKGRFLRRQAMRAFRLLQGIARA